MKPTANAHGQASFPKRDIAMFTKKERRFGRFEAHGRSSMMWALELSWHKDHAKLGNLFPHCVRSARSLTFCKSTVIWQSIQLYKDMDREMKAGIHSIVA